MGLSRKASTCFTVTRKASVAAVLGGQIVVCGGTFESENEVSRRFPKGINEIFEWQTGSVPTIFCVTDTEPQAKNTSFKF